MAISRQPLQKKPNKKNNKKNKKNKNRRQDKTREPRPKYLFLWSDVFKRMRFLENHP